MGSAMRTDMLVMAKLMTVRIKKLEKAAVYQMKPKVSSGCDDSSRSLPSLHE